MLELTFLPPFGLVWWILIGLRLRRSRRRLGTSLVAGAATLLVLFSMPWVELSLLGLLDRYPPLPLDDARLPAAEAIVVFGGGDYEAAEFGRQVGQLSSLERLRYAAWLHRRTGLPLLLSGTDAPAVEADLRDAFGLTARWTETGSRNTHENARESARILLADGIARVFLVTHFWHMPRSMAAARAAGLDPIPAPVALGSSDANGGTTGLIPHPDALVASRFFWHEVVGRVWYRLRYGY